MVEIFKDGEGVSQSYTIGFPHSMTSDSNVSEADSESWHSELFLFPGSTPGEAEELMGNIRSMVEANSSLRLVDIAFSLAVKCGFENGETNNNNQARDCETIPSNKLSSANSQSNGNFIQYAIVAGTRDELLARIGKIFSGQIGGKDDNIHCLNPIPGKVAFLFPGQGSQRVNMAADLFAIFPQMHRLLAGAFGESDANSEVKSAKNAKLDYEQILFPSPASTEEEKQAQGDLITDTRNAQPLLGIVDLAIAELLSRFGIQPDVLAGHSYGELPALCFAGVIAAEDLPALSRARADAVLAAVQEDKGRMVAVKTDQETLSGLLEGLSDVWAVNYNSPQQTVVAGSNTGMDVFLEKAAAAKVRSSELNVACAFHSPLLKDAESGFRAVLGNYQFSSPKLTVMSNTDAKVYPNTDTAIKERLAEHLVSPVRFTDEVENMHRDGVSVFIEAGPGRVLTALVAEILKGQDIAVIQTERAGVNGLTYILQALAKYVATGRKIRATELFRSRGAVALDINILEGNFKADCHPLFFNSSATNEQTVSKD